MYKRSSLPSLKRLARHWTTIRDVLRFAVRRASDERIAQIAGSLTFTTVLSVVPLVTIVFAVLSALPVFAQMQEGLRNLLLQNLMPASVSDSIFRYLNQFVAKARGLTLVGVGFLAVTSVSTMLTIDGALNTIWRVRHPRPLYQRVLVYWAILTVGPILLALSLTLTSYLISTSAGLVNRPPPFISFLINFVPWVVLTFAYAGLYVYVPNRPVEWRDALIGGLIGASAFELAKRGFAIYIASFPSYTIIYGALAALPIFLLWVPPRSPFFSIAAGTLPKRVAMISLMPCVWCASCMSRARHPHRVLRWVNSRASPALNSKRRAGSWRAWKRRGSSSGYACLQIAAAADAARKTSGFSPRMRRGFAWASFSSCLRSTAPRARRLGFRQMILCAPSSLRPRATPSI
ncbi:MAG: YihY family inner membrane protein [Burkholderiaceae bacterium]